MSFDGKQADELVAAAMNRVAIGETLAAALRGLRERGGHPMREQPALRAADAALDAWDRALACELPDDVGRLAHEAALKHLEACWAWIEDHESWSSPEEAQGPASSLFCGCLVCEVREVLHAAWPIFCAAG